MKQFPVVINTHSDSSRRYGIDGIDLRREMYYMLNKYGHYVLLRRNYKVHCSCYKEQTYKDPSNTCEYCGGTGYVSRVEKHLCRSEIAIGARSVVGSLNDSEISRLFVDSHRFYFFYYVNPSVQDIIYVVTWYGENVGTVLHEYEVIDALDKRADNGRIEYWEAYVRERQVGGHIRKIRTRQLVNNELYSDYEYNGIQFDLVW